MTDSETALRRSLILLIALYASAMTIGCGETSSADQGACFDDDGCAEGLVCQGNRCVDPSASTLSIAIALRPPNAPGDLAQQVTGLVFDPGTAIPAIEPLTLVSATLDIATDVQAVAANVSFSAQRGIPGTTVNIATNSPEVTLLPGTYEVTVRPVDATNLPPRIYTGVKVERTTTGQPTRLAFPLVQAELDEHFVRVEGALTLRYEGTTENIVPEHAIIYARELDGRGESARYETCVEDVCDGRFSVLLPAHGPTDSRQWELVASATAKSAPFPDMRLSTFTVDGDVLAAGRLVTQENAIEIDVDPILLVDVPRRRTLAGTVRAPDGAPVAGAVVSARGADEVFSFATSAATATGEDGRFELQVPASETALGTVTVSLEPKGDFASTTFDDLLLEPELSLDVALKSSVSGTVLGRDGAPIADAVVDLVPTGRIPAAAVAGQTGPDGRFDFRLEPGTWELSIRPPQRAELATLRTEIQVAAGADSNLSYPLPPTSLVFGTIVDEDGVGVAEVSIDIYAHHVDDARAQLIGRGVTDEDGVYRVFIPSPDSLDEF